MSTYARNGSEQGAPLLLYANRNMHVINHLGVMTNAGMNLQLLRYVRQPFLITLHLLTESPLITYYYTPHSTT